MMQHPGAKILKWYWKSAEGQEKEQGEKQEHVQT